MLKININQKNKFSTIKISDNDTKILSGFNCLKSFAN